MKVLMAIVKYDICAPGVIPNRTENNFCMSSAITVTESSEGKEILFQSTACGIDSKFQHHKLSIPINPDRHTTTGSVTVGKPIGMLVDGTFLFAAFNGSSDVTRVVMTGLNAMVIVPGMDR